MRHSELPTTDCAIAQALAVVGDWWTLLVVRDVAGGIHRFDQLQSALGLSRKVLAARLRSLVENGILEKQLYQPHPPRFEYHLSEAGRGLVPVLIALQVWGSRYVLGDGSITATSTPHSTEARRVSRLIGTHLPPLTLSDTAGTARDPVAGSRWTVLYCYPGAYATGTAYPPGWSDIPGARGCTLESATFRDRLEDFTARDAMVRGISTQTPLDQAAFAAEQRLPFPLLSDQELQLAVALRLPTFRAGGRDRLKRLTLLVAADRQIRGILYPVPDPVASIDEALALIDRR